jgi:F-type H+-transporting ATPase subunit epsilon
MALPTSLELQIVTPERLLLREQVDEVEIPGSEGYFGVLPGHTPLLASLAIGELWYRRGQEKTFLSIAFGFAEVLPDRVTILARLAERADEIDVDRAESARKRAEERLAQQQSTVDYERARTALLKSMARLQVSARIGVGPRTGGMKRLRNLS